MNKKILLSFIHLTPILIILSTVSLAQTQSHPLSQITPIDVNLDMFNKQIINASGLGIGVTSPSYNLHVIGTGYISSDFIVGNNLYFGATGPYLYSSGGIIYTSSGITLGGNLNANSYSIFGATWINATNVNVSNQLCLGGVCKTSWPSGGLVGGSGTANYIAMWTASDTLGNSWIYQSGSNLVNIESGKNLNLVSGSLQIGGTSVIDSSRNLVNVNQMTVAGPVNIDSGTLYVDAANNRVGIGTTSPDSKLHVIGGVCIESSDSDGCTTNGGELKANTIYEGGSTLSSKYQEEINPNSCSSGQFVTGIADDGTLSCATPTPTSGGGWADTGTIVELTTPTDSVNATTLWIDNTNQRVGIKNYNPSYELDVSGTIRGTTIYQGSNQVIDTLSGGNGISVTGSGNSRSISAKIGTGLAFDGSGNIYVKYGSSSGTAAEGNKEITISAGSGLSGGGTVTIGAGGSVTINVNTGTGLTISGDAVQIDTNVVPRKSVDETINGNWNFANGLKVGGGYGAGGLTIDQYGNILTHGNLTYSGYTYIIDTLRYNGTVEAPYGVKGGYIYPGTCNTGESCLQGSYYFYVSGSKIYSNTGFQAPSIYQNGKQVLDTGTSFSGDVSGNYNNLQLSATGVTAGTYGSASKVAQFTVDSKGRITSASNVNIAIDASQITSGTLSTDRFSAYNDLVAEGKIASGSTIVTSSNVGSYAVTSISAGTGLGGGGGPGGVTLNLNVNTNKGVQIVSDALEVKVDGTSIVFDGSGNLAHADTSSQSSVSNTGGTVVQNVSLDGYGHVTKIESVNLDGRYVNEGQTAGGDLSGTYPNPTVAKIQGRPVSSTAPSTNQALVWDGSQWVPTNVDLSSSNELQNIWYTIAVPSGTNPQPDSTSDTLSLAVASGSGLTITGDSSTDTIRFGTDFNTIQKRVSGSCADGYGIRIINSDGTVTCQRFVKQAGDTMSGDLNMGGNDIVNVENIGIGTTNPTFVEDYNQLQ